MVDWFIGIRGVTKIFSEGMDWEDAGFNVRAFEMKEVQSVTYKIIEKEKANAKTKEEIIEEINNMSHEEMARLWRFAPSGSIYFDRTKPFYKIFEKRFKELGGMTPEISKKIGW